MGQLWNRVATFESGGMSIRLALWRTTCCCSGSLSRVWTRSRTLAQRRGGAGGDPGRGGDMKGLYYTMGQYDTVAIVEAPDDETITRLALGVGARGNIRTETLRAFTDEEFFGIVSTLP